MGVYYNIGARYEIIGRVCDGSYISEYVIRDRTDKTLQKVEKAVVEQLALNKQIYNCTAQIYKNLVNLKGINCKLSQLPKYDKGGNLVIRQEVKKQPTHTADLEIKAKVYSGREVTDYVLIYTDKPDEAEMVVPRDMVIQLVKDGRVKGTTCQTCNNTVILRGNLSKVEALRN
jgi:hypothetical protein